MTWNLNDRGALITGGASGIGAALAGALTARGMRVGLIDVDRERLEAVAASLPGAQHIVADVRDGEALTTAVDELARRLGRLDVAVANAGIATRGPVRMIGAEAFEDTIDVNLLGVWRTARAALPHLLERRGYLLAMSSAAALAPPAGLAAYAASKAGVEAFGRSLRAEVAPHGVRVGVGYCLFVDTPLLAGFAADAPLPTRGPLRAYPLTGAIDATVTGIERRARRIAYPRFVHGLYTLRGLLDSGIGDRVQARAVAELETTFTRAAAQRGAEAASRPRSHAS